MVSIIGYHLTLLHFGFIEESVMFAQNIWIKFANLLVVNTVSVNRAIRVRVLFRIIICALEE